MVHDAEARGQVGAHCAKVRLEAGLLGDDGAVDVDDAVARLLDDGGRSREQVEAGRVLVPGVVGGKVLTDVSQRRGAEQRVDDRMSQHIGIGMAVEAGWMLDLHATDDQIAAGLQRVDVVARADPQVAAASCSLMTASTTPKSSGVVSLMFAGSPSMTVTSWPVAATSCASSSPTSPASAASR